MEIDEAIKHCEEVAEGCEWESTKCDESDAYENHVKAECLNCAADHRQLAAWLKELKDLREENKVLMQECDRLIKEKGELLKKSEQIAEYKRLLKAAIKDIGDMSRYCLGMCCDSCPQIHTLSRGYQSCIWQHEDEA